MTALPAGRSHLGRPLVAESYGPDGAAVRVLVFGGIHGDEPASVDAARRLAASLAAAPPTDARVVIAPAANPDGLAAGTKDNARGVDLNRNFPSRNWSVSHRPGYFPGAAPLSEPETAWLAALVGAALPERIVALHQPLRCVNWDGPAAGLAAAMSDACGWPAVASIGYPTPGSFGSRYGVDLGLPVITLELPPAATADDVDRALAALLVACAPPAV